MRAKPVDRRVDLADGMRQAEGLHAPSVAAGGPTTSAFLCLLWQMIQLWVYYGDASLHGVRNG